MGAIYLSTSATDPATLFGGTWERIQDRFLLCAGTTYAAGSEGGEAKHTLTVAEMPAHAHTVSYTNTPSTSGRYVASGTNDPRGSIETSAAGDGIAHNNMPPYLAVYAWRRTA